MKKKIHLFRGDTALWIVFMLLCCISLIEVFSTIGLSAITDMHSSPIRIFFTRHLIFVLLTALVAVVLTRFNYRLFSGFSVFLIALSAFALIAALLLGTRWLHIFSFSFQPSELAKIVLMVFLARIIVRCKDKRNEPWTFWTLIIIISIICFLIFPENLSTACITFFSGYMMILFGGVNKRLWTKGFILILILVAAGFAFLYFFGDSIDLARSSTWGHRLQAWLNPNPDELTQENMARMAIARGGLCGTGFGTTIHGRLMTQAHNDFIFSIIIEEHGLLSAIFIFLLYAFFYFRCMRIVTKCRGEFGKLCVAGIGTLIYLQAIINMCVAVGVLPVTGQTLPFISYGGSAFLCLGLGLGVIQSVAYDNNKTEYQEKMAAQSSLPAVEPTAEDSSSSPAPVVNPTETQITES